jgi:maltose alpha-D-glucosyltransferase/alpha-amylase
MYNSQKPKLDWYKDAIIYELHIKAFYDSNGDGIGDLEGLIQKLDYLSDLGVTAIWLLPFYPSPLRDDGYDISDYYTLNPAYGDIDLFAALLKEAHKRDLKVITELVINHTSDQHPWFQRARTAAKDSRERKYYVWSDDPSLYKDSRIIFQDYETSNWTWDPVAGQYYWHRFFHHQPDLNYDNPVVQEEVFRILDFWCKLGVDGFRLDAVPYLFEREGTNCENLPETHEFLKKLRAHIDAFFPGTLLLAEANMWPEDSAAYFGNGDECHMNYHFPVMPRMFMALQMEDRYPITDIFDQTPVIPENCQWAIFLRNHDELTLEMVTDEERDYMYKVYASDPKARINLGIRQRLAPLMQNNRRKIELINSLLFSLPGTPVIYYGDEIGMGDNFYLGDRDGVRTPMQWSPNRNGGFSDANPQKLYLPLILSPEYHYEIVNVEIQKGNPSSLLWYMKRIIDLRKKHMAFSRGDFNFLFVDNPKILAFTRRYEEEIILVVVNLSRYAQPVEIDMKIFAGYQPIELQSKNKFPVIKEERYFLSMGGYNFQWFSLEKVTKTVKAKSDLPEYELESLEDLYRSKFKEIFFNNILPEWLLHMRWFGAKGRGIHHISLEDDQLLQLETHNLEIAWLLIKVHYYDGLPEIYQLPVVFAPGADGYSVAGHYPQSAIFRIKINGDEGFICDAFYDTRLHRYLLAHLRKNSGYRKGIKVAFSGTDVLQQTELEHDPESSVLGSEQSNTSVVYGDKFYLKFYRKVDYDINPDEEMIRMLAGTLKFQYVPAFLGSIDWISRKGNIKLAMIQELVENHGDAWSYMQEKLVIFNDKMLTTPPDQLPDTMTGGDLTAPCKFEELPELLRELLDSSVAEQARLIGTRTAEMHLKLMATDNVPAFRPEPYTLHYQRSLYSSFNTQIRDAFQNLERNKGRLPADIGEVAEAVLKNRERIMERMKVIYSRKLDLLKIRIHGDYHLGQVLFTGKDLVILDFEGEPARSYSERRLKFSALRDVAGIIRSFHYAALGSLFLESETRYTDIQKLSPYSELWSHYMSGFFMEAYLERVKGTGLIPDNPDDIKILLDVFLLSKAFYELNYELNNRPDWVMIPLKGIQSIQQNESATYACNNQE